MIPERKIAEPEEASAAACPQINVRGFGFALSIQALHFSGISEIIVSAFNERVRVSGTCPKVKTDTRSRISTF